MLLAFCRETVVSCPWAEKNTHPGCGGDPVVAAGAKGLSDLLNAFNDHFELVFANTPELLDEVFRLRYQVLCCQAQLPGFEPSKYPDGRETDDFDRRSVHCVLRHRPSKQTAGSVRLILADPQDPQQPFPVERASARHFDPQRYDQRAVTRSRAAEISRLIVPRSGSPTRASSLAGTSGFPFPVLGLFAGVVRIASERGVTHLYAMMEPVLNRLLRRFSLHFTPIAPVIEHHGMRQAHLALLRDLSLRTYHHRREVWKLLTDEGRHAPSDGVPSSDAGEPAHCCSAG